MTHGWPMVALSASTLRRSCWMDSAANPWGRGPVSCLLCFFWWFKVHLTCFIGSRVKVQVSSRSQSGAILFNVAIVAYCVYLILFMCVWGTWFFLLVSCIFWISAVWFPWLPFRSKASLYAVTPFKEQWTPEDFCLTVWAILLQSLMVRSPFFVFVDLFCHMFFFNMLFKNATADV